METKQQQQLVLRPISARRSGSVAGEVAAAMERSSLAAASFRVYYSLRPGAVPFLWESTPGTPKSGGGGGAAPGAATAAVTPAPADREMLAAAAAAHHQLIPPISPAPAEMAAARRHQQLIPPITPPPASYHSSQLKKGRRRRCRARASCAAAAGLLRALLAALGIRRRSHRRLSPAASLV